MPSLYAVDWWLLGEVAQVASAVIMAVSLTILILDRRR